MGLASRALKKNNLQDLLVDCQKGHTSWVDLHLAAIAPQSRNVSLTRLGILGVSRGLLLD